ncbi:MAG TPA: RluA family pseudouridine synthase [Desulfuromonadaceae bacterium]
MRTLLPTASAAYPRKLIKSGAAKLNGSIATPDDCIFFKDLVTLKESAALSQLLSEELPAIDVLYEDSLIAIVNKPAGLAMHRTAELEHDLVELATAYMTWRDTPCKLYPVNRLDRGTSGAVILAKSSSSAGIYGRQVKETGLDKLYLALVQGITDQTGTITQPLDDKESETHYKLLTTGEDCSLLAVVPISGRMHQIRRHLEMIGHPVLGDKRYGSFELKEMTGFALHSFRTTLTRPEPAGSLTVCAPFPLPFSALCNINGINPDHLLLVLRNLAQG